MAGRCSCLALSRSVLIDRPLLGDHEGLVLDPPRRGAGLHLRAEVGDTQCLALCRRDGGATPSSGVGAWIGPGSSQGRRHLQVGGLAVNFRKLPASPGEIGHAFQVDQFQVKQTFGNAP